MADHQQHGKKRKLQEYTKEKDMQTRIDGKFHHDLKEAKKAAKKAKAFETQKLVKKLKQLRKKSQDGGADVHTCEAELEQLKALDHEALAHTALKSRLLKDKILSGNEHVQASVLRELQSNPIFPSSGSSAKVQSRLLSSKILASEISQIIEGLRAVVLPRDEEDTSRSTKTRRLNETEEDGDVKMRSAGKDDGPTVGDVDTGLESGAIGDDEGEPGSDAGWESGSIDEEGAQSDDEAVASTSVVPKTSAKRAQAATASTFLPSLSVGFIKGSDDSDWEEQDEKAGDIPERKNRRGQRARRMIWEKKYGQNANHKKKEAETERNSRGARQSKPWANANFTRPTAPQNGYRPAHAAAQRKYPPHNVAPVHTAPPPPPQQQRENAESGNLHPSWLAKKRAQEQQNIMAAASAGPSKKIKFD
ncbi:Bud-site selection protein [Cylindrobasidium torrendii FP15055 ss-10]|uniref:Bud-site selection protein n=1 Tax=Cylindrobasidium torrendii FP15055 ss-10 TaxID=1314674 RepID=A0A0D7B640_9AGAR|nr:Bud-site selection protein [Cylindrobasidium torrendii FP15055 ss-10]